MKCLLCLVVILCTSPSGFTQDKPNSGADGNDLRKNCGAIVDGRVGSYEAGYCYGLIDGVVQLGNSLPRAFPTHCFPSGVTYGQLVKVVMKYLEEHPEKLNGSATLLIAQALHEAFPCHAASK